MLRNFVRKLLLLATLVAVSNLPFAYMVLRNQNIRKEYLLANIDKHRILDRVPSPRIVFVGGSNLAFGLDSEMVKQELGYNPVNMGLYLGLGLRYMLGEVQPYMREGDVVVIIPEYEIYFPELIGDADFLPRLLIYYPLGFTYVSGFKDIIRISNNMVYVYSQLVRSSVSFFIKPTDFDETLYTRMGFNEYGDLTTHLHSESHPPHSEQLLRAPWQINHDAIQVLNDFNSDMQARGVKVYYLFPSVSTSFVARDHETLDALYQVLQKELTIPVLSPPERYIYAFKYFYDTNYHLNAEGREIRTHDVIDDLKHVLQPLNQ